MATGKLEVEVIARTEALESGLARAEAEVRKSADQVAKLSAVVKKLESDFANLGMGAKLSAEAVNASTASMVSAARSSNQLTLDFEKLGAAGDQLKFTFADTEQGLEDMIVSMQKMSDVDMSAGVNAQVEQMGASLQMKGGDIGSNFGKQMLGGITRGLGAAAVAAMAIKILDSTLSKSLEHMQGNPDSIGIGTAIGEGIAEGIASVPVFGNLFELGGEMFDKLLETPALAAPILGPAALLMGGLGGQVSMERDQEKSREEAQKNMAENAKKARIAERNARAEEEMRQKAQRVEDARADLDLAKLRTKLDQASIEAAKGETHQAIFDEAELKKELLLKQRDLEIEHSLRAISENDAEERRLVEARIKEEYVTRLQAVEQEEIRKLQALDEEFAAKEALEKELEEKKKEAARQRAEEELKRQTELAQTAFRMHKELADARADAETKIAGATATFSTAGGSFTTGVNAQLNEQKLLTKISTRSQEFLKQITMNTARMGGALSLA